MMDKQKLLNWLQHMYEGNKAIDMKGEYVAYDMVIKRVQSGAFDSKPVQHNVTVVVSKPLEYWDLG